MNGRDVFRILYGGRFVIAAAAIITAVAFFAAAVVLENSGGEFAVPLPELTGEYLTDAELLNDCAEAYSDTQYAECFDNLQKYQISVAIADILNDKVAKDMDSLLKTYRSRADKARAEAEALKALAWQARHSAEVGAASAYSDRMRDYLESSVSAAEKDFEAEYCENIISILTDESVVPDENAEERAAADIENIKAAFAEIGKTAAGRALPLGREAAAAVGFFVGLLLGAAVVSATGLVRLSLRLAKQKKAVAGKKYAKLMDEINFRG